MPRLHLFKKEYDMPGFGGTFSPNLITEKAMGQKAKELEVEGVGFFFLGDPSSTHFKLDVWVYGRMERDPDPVGRGVNDKGSNYLGVAAGKWAEMISTGIDSGNAYRPVKTGENGFRGGRIVKIDDNTALLLAFSGGSPEQDLEIVDTAIEALGLSLD